MKEGLVKEFPSDWGAAVWDASLSSAVCDRHVQSQCKANLKFYTAIIVSTK